MTKVRFTLKALTLAVFMLAFSALANAQATRTWVSGVGDDVNPCSRTAPCKTFAGAISKTFINGEIDVLDPGGFGVITITKSITIDGTGTFASILASGSPAGVTVNLTDVSGNDPLHSVRLRGLSINGTGASGTVGTRTGTTGVRILAGAGTAPSVYIQDCFISNFSADGILMNSNGGDLVVNNSSIVECGGSGIRSLSTGGVNRLSIDNVHADENQQGIRFEGNSFGTVSNSTASNNSLNGFVANPVTIGSAQMNLIDSVASNNHQFGVFAGGTGFTGTVNILGITAFHNITNQLSIGAGGSLCSNAKNHIGSPTQAPNCVFTDQ
jgi:hypothetical protein